MKIGIFGGTFNPLHNGHIIAAQEVLNYTDLDEIWFVPCIKNMLKENPGYTSPGQRLEMLKSTLKGFPKFKVSDFEIRNGFMYTADAISALKRKFPQHKFYLIMGSALAEQFHNWKEPLEILKEARLIVVPMPSLPKISDKKILKCRPIVLKDAVRTDISSTAVRKYVKEEKSIFHLVPKAVEKYIEEKKLYKK